MSACRSGLLLFSFFLAAGCGKSSGPKAPSPTPAPNPTPVPSAIRFEDVTPSSGVTFVHENGAAGKKWMPETMGSGVAAFDADGDGRIDLLFANGRRWPESGRVAPTGAKPAATLAFYRNVTPKGGAIAFEDATKAAGLGVTLFGMGLAVGDVDGNGTEDVLVTGVGENRLFLGDGKGRFRDATKGSGLEPGDGKAWTTSAALADFDGDGRLDAFLCRYVDWTPATDMHCTLDGTSKAYCTPERYPGRPSQLLLGLGGGRFRDVTEAAGVSNPLGKALGVAVRDVDGDGRPDLAVANDTSPNNLYINSGMKDGIPIFTDVAIPRGIAVGEDGRARGAMGIAFGDTKNEGGVSLAIGNFSNETWSFWSAGPKGDVFLDEVFPSGLGRTTLVPLTFGVAFADFDQDFVLDLVGVNGHVETAIQKVQATSTHAQTPLVFRGLGAGRFADVSAQAGPAFAVPFVGRGLAVADLDGDGRPDLVATANGGPARILRNVSEAGASVVLELFDAKGATAVGARVTSTSGGRTRVDEVSGGDGYLSVNERAIRIGLGTDSEADHVAVRWPNGKTSEASGLDRGRYRWREGGAPEPVP